MSQTEIEHSAVLQTKDTSPLPLKDVRNIRRMPGNEILRERVRVLEVENNELLNKLNGPARVIPAKLAGKTYRDELRMVVYILATSNVAIESMRNVVNCVLELGKQELSEFPDVATCRAMVHEMNPLTKLHVGAWAAGVE